MRRIAIKTVIVVCIIIANIVLSSTYARFTTEIYAETPGGGATMVNYGWERELGRNFLIAAGALVIAELFIVLLVVILRRIIPIESSAKEKSSYEENAAALAALMQEEDIPPQEEDIRRRYFSDE